MKSKNIIQSLLVAGLVIGFSLPAWAESYNVDKNSALVERKAMREKWENMSPEEREQMREKMKQHWEKMSPEEREARRQEMREHWEKMSPEERGQFKQDFGQPEKAQ